MGYSEAVTFLRPHSCGCSENGSMVCPSPLEPFEKFILFRCALFFEERRRYFWLFALDSTKSFVRDVWVARVIETAAHSVNP